MISETILVCQRRVPLRRYFTSNGGRNESRAVVGDVVLGRRARLIASWAAALLLRRFIRPCRARNQVGFPYDEIDPEAMRLLEEALEPEPERFGLF